MKNTLFGTFSRIFKLLEYFFYILGIMTFLGLILTFFFKEDIASELENYNIPISNFLVAFSCVRAIILLICISMIFRNVSVIMYNVSNENYFVKSNIYGCKNITILLIIITALEFVSGCLFSYLKVSYVSGIFEVSIKEYILNFIFIILSYSAYKVFAKGLYYKKDSESVI